MALCALPDATMTARCLLPEDHDGGHRGVVVCRDQDFLVLSWAIDPDTEVAHPAIVDGVL